MGYSSKSALAPFKGLAVMAAASLLAACGGGGGGGAVPAGPVIVGGSVSGNVPSPSPTPVPAPLAFPASGVYSSVSKPEGAEPNIRLGLSLIHPAERTSEYPIELPSANVTAQLEIQSGTVDIPNKRVTNLTPNALLYIVGGDVKRLPLVANGLDPKVGIQSAGVSNLCTFAAEATLRNLQGTDYGDPLSSFYYATNKGADGVCGTADDRQSAITFTAQGRPVVASVTGFGVAGTFDPVLAVLRDPLTLKPSGSVFGYNILIAPPNSVVRAGNTSASPPINKIVGVSLDAAVAERGNRLIVANINGAITSLDASLTAGTGWESAGYDATSFYVYRNSGLITNAASSTYRLLRISKVNPTATVLASGSGFLLGVGLGSTQLFGTVLAANGYTLSRFSTSTPGVPGIALAASTTVAPVLTVSNRGVHLIQRTSLTSSGLTTNSNDIVDEATNTIIYTAANTFPFDFRDSNFRDFTQSVTTSGFTFIGNQALTALSLGADLISYDAELKRATVLGRFPSVAEFGASRAFAFSGLSEKSTFGIGALNALSNTTPTSFLATPRRLFSYDPSVANSIQYTTSVR